MKVKSESESCSFVSDSLWPHGLYTVHGILQARILEWVAFPFSRGSSQPRDRTGWILYQLNYKGIPRILEWVAIPSPVDLPDLGIEPGTPELQVDSLPTELPRKPKNTGVGSLSLLQWIFLTWELNRDFLLYRQIFYQMSYQGSPP